ncbi:LysR family transcriptional regulator [Burkholderia sp. AU31624]|uniref:LysR family transcriptional regulator n=1 Tax=unclassified Burkholderia TaxID=2613784 RepID=UPI000B79F1F6|nr:MULTISPECIES: LysR family transcriptional regulator [unclassified Burkholderia]MBN3731568.1 LysR family transcriptional regulator [Burkholderia sp. Tr-20390]MCA8062131.1 LysR family transcriptional regulator [Burkholderia sp. AU38729]MCA8253558.1 LysR family transcriptional regulator [Burkholderia sp. AU31624]MDN7486863.1 LysR family transcriptional regulator [Burkholderia sp. AU45274]OXI19302.1 LysR family transcriptional regulator [Burkholderia sp. AU15512]
MKKGARETGIDHMGAMRAFVRVVETGSFSAVAKEMHVSTSTVARKVTAIEEALGVALLHRSTHSVTLTEAGHIYLERAVTLIADLDDTLRVVAELNAQPSGPLKLTAPVAFGRRHLAPLVAPFLARYPTIQLDVRLTDNHNDLVAGGFDLDIHEGENYLDNLVVHRLSRNDSILCATPGYLDRCGRPVTPDDLKQHNCLRYVHPEGDPRWDLVNGDAHHSVLPAGNLVTDHSELLLEATCAGLGIAEFEIWLVRDLLASGRLEAVLPRYRLQNRLTGEYIYIAYLANRRSSAKLRVLKDFLAEHLAHIGELSALELTKIRGASV